jgi:hypothetical protein
MTLADYTFYVEEYQGSIIPAENFAKYAEKVDLILKRMILNNTTYLDYYERQYNLAVCEISDYNFKTKGVSAKNESLGDYSITYLNGDSNYEISKIASDYLGTTGLLNSAVYGYAGE